MFTIFDEKMLSKLLSSFCTSFAKRNNFNVIPTYAMALQAISSFALLPDWRETRFFTIRESKSFIPLYIERRHHFFSEIDCSPNLLANGIIVKYFEALKMSYHKAAYFCSQLIKVILFANLNSYIEGTSADDLGIAHIDFKNYYNENDFNELIIHQITHMLLFIDDYIDPHILHSHKNLPVKTPIKHKRGNYSFPIYTLYHSFCVGIEVLHYRLDSLTLNALVNYHADSLTLLNRCKECMFLLAKNISLFTAKGQTIMREYEKILNELRIEY